ncbi:MAG: CHAT domain-containing protein [Xenococcus sp. (in: cyanobacteria)]
MELIANMSLFFSLIFASILITASWYMSKYEHFFKNHNYHKAMEVAEQSLKFFYRFYGNHYLTGIALAGFGNAYAALGQRTEAKRLLLKAIDIFNESFFIKSKSKLALYVKIQLSLKLSEFYLLEGDLDKSETYCREILDLEDNKKVSGIFIAQAHQLMTLIQLTQGKYNIFVVESSKSKYVFQNWVKRKQKFHKIRKKLKFANAIFTDLFTFLITFVLLLMLMFFPFLRTQRNYIFIFFIFAVLESINRVLNFLNKQNSEHQEAILQYGSIVEHVGYYYQILGDYEVAEEKYNEALYILSTLDKNNIGKELALAQNLQNQGSLQETRGNFELTSFEKRQTYYEKAMSNYDEALRIYESKKIYSSNEDAFVGYRIQIITCLLQKYLNYAKLVGIEVAENEVYQAFTDAEKLSVYPVHYKLYVCALIDLGLIYHKAGNYSKAEEQYFKAKQIIAQYLAIAFEEKGSLNFAQACLYVVTKQFRKALKNLTQSIETNNVLLLQFLSVASEKHRISILQNNYFFFSYYVTLVYEFFPNSPSEVGTLFDFALRRKAIGAEILTTQRDVLLEDRYPPQKLKELKLKLKNLTKKRREIAHKMFEEIASSNVTDLQKLNRDRETLEEELAREIPELNLEKKLKAVDRQMVSQALPSGSVLIEILLVNFIDFEFPNHQIQQVKNPHSIHYIAFILQAGQPDDCRLVDLGRAQTIDRLLVRFRAQVTENLDDIPTGIALRTRIFDPLVSEFKKCSKLFISPDENLTQIPFEILPTDDGRRLIDLYSISYLSTGRDFLRFNFKPSIESTTAIVIADPDYNYALEPNPRASSDNDDFKRLLETIEEGETIASLLGAQKWFGNRALKESIFKYVHSPRILHIATHGFFMPNPIQDFKQEQMRDNISQLLSSYWENPLLRSCLALAGANWKSRGFTPHPDAGNGILTAEEVANLNLTATELVVLSACETGQGETLAGEGVFGLRRAFVLAGAKTLIMSLWSVPDKHTKELMVSFYNRLLNGESRSEALRNSQLEIRDKYPNPYYWGAFICQGDPEPIPEIHKIHPDIQ